MDSIHEKAGAIAQLDGITLLALLLGAALLCAVLIAPAARKTGRTIVRRCGPYARQALGWMLIIIGLLGLVLPGPGIPFLVVGIALVGDRHPLIRRVAVLIKVRLRAWARQAGWRGWLGTRGWRLVRELGVRLRAARVRLRARRRPQHARKPEGEL